MRPLAIDLCCGLGGWTDGLLAEGYDVIGFDIERHVYGAHRYPAQLVVQDVLTLHGSQLRTANLIVASPPCQKYSYMAMPWTRAKAMAAAIRADETGHALADLNQIFDACFRIQREACEAAGRYIPMIVENVKGAQPWVGRARWSFGSFYLWGDVPALMPPIARATKVPGMRFDGRTQCFQQAAVEHIKNTGGSWFNVAHNTTSGTGRNPDGRKTAGAPHIRDGESHTRHLTSSLEHEGVKQRGSGASWFDDALNERRRNATAEARKVGGDWFGSYAEQQKAAGTISPGRMHSSKSNSRKMASAMIAKIPLPLSRHIARVFKIEAWRAA